MHRSGTSLVTKCFELFGYGLGETLMEPSEDNPKGFSKIWTLSTSTTGCSGITDPTGMRRCY